MCQASCQVLLSEATVPTLKTFSSAETFFSGPPGPPGPKGDPGE